MKMNLGQRIAWVAIGRLGNITILIVVNVFLSRSLSLADYGHYQQIWLFLNIAVPMFLFGFPISINFFLPGLDKNKQDQFVIQTVGIILSLAFLFAALSFIFAPYIAHHFLKNDSLTPLVHLAAWIGFGLIGSGFIDIFLINYHRHKWLGSSLILFATVFLLAVLGGQFIGQSLYWIFVCLTIFALFRLTYSLVLLLKVLNSYHWHWRQDWFRRQIRYVAPVGLRDGIDITSLWADKLLITTFFAPQQFARYFNGAIEAPVIDLVVQSTLKVLMPDFAAAYHRQEPDEVVGLLQLAARRIAVIIFPIAVFFIVVGPDLMVFLFGESYRISGGYFRIFSMIIFCRAAAGGTVLLATGHTRLLLYGTFLDIFLLLSLSFILMPIMGLYGPALASVIGTYCQSMYNLWQVSRVIDRPLRRLLPWRSLGRLLLFSVIIGIVSMAVKQWDNSFLNLMSAGFLFSGLYLFGGIFLRIFDGVELDVLQKVWRKLVAVLVS